MRDITPILMGDPGSSPRRMPTEREMREWKAPTSHEQKKKTPERENIFVWPLGHERIFTSWRKARNAQSILYSKGLLGILRTNSDGTVSVRRVQ